MTETSYSDLLKAMEKYAEVHNVYMETDEANQEMEKDVYEAAFRLAERCMEYHGYYMSSNMIWEA